MGVAWSNNVNTNFYGMSKSVKPNVIKTEFECGKVRTCLKNSTPKRTFTFTLHLWSRNEESAFWTWYENNLLSGSLPFNFKNLVTNDASDVREYLLTSEPSVSDGNYPKELSIECEEL